MKITIVRHAQTEQNYLEICQGSANNVLNEAGIRDCNKVKMTLKDKHYDYCYMSPLARCVQTAVFLIGDRVQTIPDNRLIERNLGKFEGMPRKFYDAKKYWDYNLNSNDDGVEPVQDVFKRCEDFLNFIKERHKGESIMIVTHGSPCRCLRHLIKGTNLEKDNLLDVEIKNLYVEEFEIED